jgi:hypothetical protein
VADSRPLCAEVAAAVPGRAVEVPPVRLAAPDGTRQCGPCQRLPVSVPVLVLVRDDHVDDRRAPHNPRAGVASSVASRWARR